MINQALHLIIISLPQNCSSMNKTTAQVRGIRPKIKNNLSYTQPELNLYQNVRLSCKNPLSESRKKVMEITQKYRKRIQLRKQAQNLKNQINTVKNLVHCQKTYCKLFSQETFSRHSQLKLKKSIFQPSKFFIEAILERISTFQNQVPMISINHYNNHWLLLQAPYFSHDLFQKINQGILGNGYYQLIRIFSCFCKLIQKYGYFQPTARMIFMDGVTAYVWINEDIFSMERMIPLGQYEGQRLFIMTFFAIIKAELKGWQIAYNINSIDDALKLLQWRASVYAKTVASKHCSNSVQNNPNKRSPSIHHEIADRQLSRMKSSNKLSKLQQSQNWNANVLEKELEELMASRNPNEMSKISNQLSLTSTSSTIEQFCQKSRLTIEKIKRGYQQLQSHKENQFNQGRMKNQFDCLFIEMGKPSLVFAVEGETESLQKITEQMQEILI